jgi:hypothetical protein
MTQRDGEAARTAGADERSASADDLRGRVARTTCAAA